MAEMTPMKRQYYEVHQQVPDCLLFFRLGDFYEMFDDDARLAARELDLTLTTRDRNKPAEEQTPMCGVPYHAAETYIARLIAKGYKVAICEQMEDPAAATGIVDRDIIRIITPGTVTDDSMLEDSRSNYLASVWLQGARGAVAFCDVSTGEFCVAEFGENAEQHIINELGRFMPREALLCPEAEQNTSLRGILKNLDCLPEFREDFFQPDSCAERVFENFNEKTDSEETMAAGALLSYLRETQKFDLSHIRTLTRFGEGRYMELDYTSRRSLELTENLRTGEKKDCLLWVLDRTGTPMGSRLLRSWVERPLLNPVAIRRRLNGVNELFGNSIARAELSGALSDIGDIQRLIGRCVYGSANARDVLALGRYFSILPVLQDTLSFAQSAILKDIRTMDTLSELQENILQTIQDDPPFSVREGGFIRTGVSEELDYLRSVRDNGAEMLAQLEVRERERTGIKKLKVGYNRVFGYYIEIPRSAGSVTPPEEYVRKQTLTSGERYFTPELKELESALLNARDRIGDLEYNLFSELRNLLAVNVDRIQTTAAAVAELDCLCSLAEVAFRNHYTMPELDLSDTIDIREGRHPVVEQAMRDTLFVPNDTILNGSGNRVAIITGPNMAGKSTYMRQTALIVLMAQMGSFVPAKSAAIGIVDRVFTRIGASDNLAGGQSTFMVEMAEMAAILKNATKNSLLILDEIGRGTSTYDGMAIARAMLEFCADTKTLGARTMFATHYHELSALEGSLPGVKNYNITARKQNGTLVFLRKIVPGSADDSYGIEVAKLAGVPDSVIRRARGYLQELEETGTSRPTERKAEESQVNLTQMAESGLMRELETIVPDTLTPIEALNQLYQLRQKYLS